MPQAAWNRTWSFAQVPARSVPPSQPRLRRGQWRRRGQWPEQLERENGQEALAHLSDLLKKGQSRVQLYDMTYIDKGFVHLLKCVICSSHQGVMSSFPTTQGVSGEAEKALQFMSPSASTMTLTELDIGACNLARLKDVGHKRLAASLWDFRDGSVTRAVTVPSRDLQERVAEGPGGRHGSCRSGVGIL